MTASAGRRVLMMVENNCYPGDIRVRREAHSLVAAGFQVTVISPRQKDQTAIDTVNGVRVYRYRQPPQGGSLWGFLWEYGYSMAATCLLTMVVFVREGFDVIHCHNPPDLFVLIALPYKLLGKKFIFDHHDLSPEMYTARFGSRANRFVRSVLLFFERLTCFFADHVIATNESYKQVDITRNRVSPQEITVVRNGPDLKRVHPVAGDPELRQKAGTILGYVGVMGFQDGIDYLLRALDHLRTDLGHHDFYCVLIGKGDARDSLKELATKLKLNEHVWFTGCISDADMLKFLCTADVCVDPDPKNPFNDKSTMIKMMEYMALSKPIVAFDLTEHRATAGKAALYAQPNSELDFATQIARLIENPVLRKTIGEFGQQRIAERLAWHHQEQHLLAAYDQLNDGTHQVTSARQPGPEPATRDFMGQRDQRQHPARS